MDHSAFSNSRILYHSTCETRCPTCRAAWRSVAECPRCGTDLTQLMQVAAKAWKLREAARTALCEGERAPEAVALARASCQLHATPRGQRLLVLALLEAGQLQEASLLIEQGLAKD